MHDRDDVTRRRTTTALIPRKVLRDTEPSGVVTVTVPAWLEEAETEEHHVTDHDPTNVVVRLAFRPSTALV